MRSYRLIIQDRKYEGYKKIASFIFILNAAFFFALATRSISITNKIILFTAAFILAVYAIYSWMHKKKKERSFIAVYILITVIWITDTPFWYFSLFFIGLMILQLRMEKDFRIKVNETGITIDGFLLKRYNWTDLNNVIIKDGLLTLDFKSDKVLQVEPDWEDEETNAETEEEFNDFCRICLRSPNPAST